MIKKGSLFRNLFIILEGTAEAFKEKKSIAVYTKGDMCDTIAFILDVDHDVDVYAVSDYMSVISLRKEDLQKFLFSKNESAFQFMYNISRILCRKVEAIYHLILDKPSEKSV